MQKCWKRLNNSAKNKIFLKVSEEFIPICLCVKLIIKFSISLYDLWNQAVCETAKVGCQPNELIESTRTNDYIGHCAFFKHGKQNRGYTRWQRRTPSVSRQQYANYQLNRGCLRANKKTVLKSARPVGSNVLWCALAMGLFQQLGFDLEDFTFFEMDSFKQYKSNQRRACLYEDRGETPMVTYPTKQELQQFSCAATRSRQHYLEPYRKSAARFLAVVIFSGP